MTGLYAHIRILLSGFTLATLILIGLPTTAWAQIIPLNLSINNDNSVTLSMRGETRSLQLNQSFTPNTPTPFHVKGIVDNNPNHRINLTVHEWPSDVVGSLNVDGEWYQIESNTSAARLLGDLATDSPLIAMQPDVNLVGDQARGVLDRVLQHDSLTPLSNVPTSASARLTSGLLNKNSISNRTTTRAIRVGIIVDSLFDDHHSGRGLARAMTIMNGVDAILQNSLGLAVEVAQVVDYTNAATDPFRGLAPSIDQSIMPALQTQRLQNEQLPDDLSLVHLFTGHLDQNIGTLVGLGWLNSVCNRAGFDVSLSSPFLFDTLLATHEIMHNLGAPHDNGSQCQNFSNVTNEYLMWSNIDGNTSAELSACSIETARASLAADCTVDAIDLAIEISLLTQADTTSHELTLQVTNTDASRTAIDITTLTLLPGNTQILALPTNCELVVATLRCRHYNIIATQNTQTRLSIETSNAQDSRVRSEVVLNTHVDHNSVNNVAVLNLPNALSAGNNLVTLSTNNATVNPTLVSSDFDQGDIQPSPANQINRSRTDIFGIGSTSDATVWTMLLFLLSRLSFTINRVMRNRL